MDDYKVQYLTEAIQEVANSILGGVHTCLPGKINKYDYTTRKAEVKPLLKKKYKDGTILSMPSIVNVPVVFPGSSESVIHFPLKKGDGVLLIFSERSMEIWLSKGGDVETGDPRKFDLTDAIAIPGLFPFNISNIANNNDDMIMQYKNTAVRIKSNGDVDIGQASFKKVMTEDIITKFNAHTHLDPVSGFTGTPSTGAPPVVYSAADATLKVGLQ